MGCGDMHARKLNVTISPKAKDPTSEPSAASRMCCELAGSRLAALPAPLQHAAVWKTAKCIGWKTGRRETVHSGSAGSGSIAKELL